MARWYRSGRYYGRNRGYRRNGYYYKRSNTSRKSYGNMKAAKQQADQSTFTINIPSEISCFLKNNSLIPNQPNQFGIYPMNIFDVLRKSEFYNSYASMYDEFKIDRIKVKLLPTQFTYTASSGSGGTTYKNVTVYTAWDRTGLSYDQVILNITGTKGTDTQIGFAEDDGTADHGKSDGIYCVVGEDITTYSSAESRIVNPGTNTSIVRWLNPKTMQEKSQWISTSALREWYTGYDESNGRFYGIKTGYASGNNLNFLSGEAEMTFDTLVGTDGTKVASIDFSKLSALNSDNPCYLIEDNGIKFKPTLLVGVYPAVASSESNICRFNVETEVVCTFRGLRKAKVVAA